MQRKTSPVNERVKYKSIISVPNLFTALNIFCGFLAVVQILSEKYLNACWLVFIACVFDALDGRIARIAGGSTELGMQMDSLSDVVSSGLAPAILVYEVHLKDFGHVGLVVSFLPLLFSAFRLARYNVFTLHRGKTQDFIGMPAPMAAITLCGLILLYLETQWSILLRILIILVPALSLLMASTLPYDGFPRFSFRAKGANRIKLIYFILALALFIIIPYLVLFPFMFIYMLSGPIRAVFSLLKNGVTDIAIFPEDRRNINNRSHKNKEYE